MQQEDYSEVRSREVLREDGEREKKERAKEMERVVPQPARLRNLFILLSRARERVTSGGADVMWRRMRERAHETKTNC